MKLKISFFVFFITFCLKISGFTQSISLSKQDPDAKLKAVYLYNFAKKTKIKSNILPEYLIVVLGKTKMTEELKKIASTKQINSKKITVKEINKFEELGACNLLFVCKDFKNQSLTELPKLQNILIVTEIEGLCSSESIINFIYKDSKIQYEFSPKNASKNNIEFESSITNSAKEIIQ